jgi:hypothetical protein
LPAYGSGEDEETSVALLDTDEAEEASGANGKYKKKKKRRIKDSFLWLCRKKKTL